MGGTGSIRRRRAPALALLGAGLAALAAAAPVPPAGAAEEAKTVRLEVTAGYGGYATPGRSLPVRVTIDANRLLAGDLVVGGRNGAIVRMPVEVPGGSVKRFTVVLAPSFGGDELVTASVVDGSDRVLAKGEHRVSTGDGVELVGLLPEVLGGRTVPGPAALSVDAGTARFAALVPDDFSSADALDPLAAIAGRWGELEALRPNARQALGAWLAGGGQLLVDDTPASTGVLPATWVPGPGITSARVGQGQVRLTAGAVTGLRLAALVDPTTRTSLGGGFGGDGVAQTVARDAGLRLPRITTLLGFLGVYVLVVGPVTAVVLRRKRRPELAWVVVPALALVFTVAAYGAGSRSRSGSNLGHGTVVMIDGASSTALSYVGVTRPGRGEARVSFPDGWSVRGDPNSGRAPAPVVVGGDGPEAVVPLAVGEFGLVKAQGPVTLPGEGLELTARVDGAGDAGGTVHNRLPFRLDEVTVFVGNGSLRLGRLAPGEERTWTLDADRLPRFDNGEWRPGAPWFDRGPGDWFVDGREGPEGRDGVVNLPLWQEIRADLGPDERRPGIATVVGWTRSFEPDIRVDGQDRDIPGRTAVVVRSALEPTEVGSTPALAVRRDVLRGNFPSGFGKFFGPAAGPFGDESVMRFTLPAGADPTNPLVLKSSARLRSIEVWQDGAWKVVKAADGSEQAPQDNGKAGFETFPPPPSDPSTATTVVVPGPVPVTTGPPPIAPPVAPAPFPGGLGGPGFDASHGIALPRSAVAGRVVFVRVRFGDWMGQEITLTLGEAA